MKDLADRYESQIVIHEKGEFYEFLRRQNIPFEILSIPVIDPMEGKMRTLWNLIVSYLKIKRYLKENRIRFVHTNESTMNYTWALPSKHAGARHVWQQLNNWTPSAWERFLIRQPALVACNSDYTYDLCIRKNDIVVQTDSFDREKMQLDQDRAKCKRQILDRLGISGDPPLIGYFANYVNRKRPIQYLNAAREIQKKHSAAVFVMAGNERDYAKEDLWKHAKEIGLDKNLYILDFVDNMWEFLAGLDILLITAVNETVGRTPIEAALVGTPSVATRHAGLPATISHIGFGALVDPDDVQGYAESVFEMIQNPVVVDTSVAYSYFVGDQYLERIRAVYP
ncbi:MAG: glycosyltransferase family 4 protein [Candidatus Hinthialibacter sp.]